MEMKHSLHFLSVLVLLTFWDSGSQRNWSLLSWISKCSCILNGRGGAQNKVGMYGITNVLVKAVRPSLKWIGKLSVKKSQSFFKSGISSCPKAKYFLITIPKCMIWILMFRDRWEDRFGLVGTMVLFLFLFVIVALLLFLNAFRQVMHFPVDCSPTSYTYSYSYIFPHKPWS